MNRKIISGILAVCIAGMMSFDSVPSCDTYSGVSAAQSIEELEQLKRENSEKIAEIKEKIAQSKEIIEDIEKDEEAKKEYQDNLNRKIDLQNQNIDYVVSQINKIDDEINENQQKIEELEEKIELQKEDIDKNFSLFKQRLRVSYMSGKDNLAAVLTGTTDFYDLLAKMELVSKVAEHDDEIVKTLRAELDELNELNSQLEIRHQELDVQMNDAKHRKTEFQEALNELTEDYQATQAELDRLNSEKEDVEADIEDKESAIKEKEEEHERIVAEIEAAQEAIRQEKLRQEEEKRKAEEAAKAEAERKAAESRQTSQSSQTSQTTSAPAQTQTYSSGFAWPVPGFYSLSSTFGYRSFDNSYHKGVDIAGGGIAGVPIVAAADGVVVSCNGSCTHNYSKYSSCGCGGGYGNYVSIAHDDGVYSTLYGHASSIIVSTGQRVSKGQTIGYVGTTGYSTGNHCHFEVIQNGTNVNPMNFF